MRPAAALDRVAAGAAAAVLLLGARGAAVGDSATCSSPAASLRAVQAAQATTQTIEADFVQVKHVSLLGEPLVSTGRVAFKQPDRVRMQVDHPRPATIVIAGGDVRLLGVPAPEPHAPAIGGGAGMFSRLGALLTGSTAALGDEFSVTARCLGEDGRRIQIEAVRRPDAGSRTIKRVGLTFSGEEMLVEGIRMEDDFGDRLEVTLHNVRRNGNVPDSVFER